MDIKTLRQKALLDFQQSLPKTTSSWIRYQDEVPTKLIAFLIVMDPIHPHDFNSRFSLLPETVTINNLTFKIYRLWSHSFGFFTEKEIPLTSMEYLLLVDESTEDLITKEVERINIWNDGYSEHERSIFAPNGPTFLASNTQIAELASQINPNSCTIVL